MRAYRLSAEASVNAQTVQITRFAGSQSAYAAMRREIMESFGVKFKDVDVEEVDIPTSKPDLLAFINALL